MRPRLLNLEMKRGPMKTSLWITAVMLLLLAHVARAETNAAHFVWGEAEGGLRLGLRVEPVGAVMLDLYSFTVAVTNCSTNTIALLMGNSWDGPAAPLLTFGEDRKDVRMVQPPHIEHRGRGITHIPNPITVELKPGEAYCIHHSTFVPPMPVGTWPVDAQHRPHGDRTLENSRVRDIPNLWRGWHLLSGSNTVTITSEHLPPPDPPAARRLLY